MIIAIMQPYLFPYIGYWMLIHAVDTFVIFDDVNFIKKGYINRNSILMNYEPYRFTLELFGASQNKLINEIEVGSNQQKILKTIEHAYKKSPYFHDTFSVVKQILSNMEKNLARYLGASLVSLSRYLGIETNFIYSSDLEKSIGLKGEAKIIDICKRLNADTYINPIGGRELYSKEAFKKENISLFYISANPVEYHQFNNEFVPNLSIIDVMMFNSIDDIQGMLHNYKLI